ncbi:CDP-diacylglycerol--glycerol-3-phosphate 3-phosphatidyltransferase [Microbacteriaceae bacterium MWH-Ta3]|nr:CDP-diacylglycerol--glycerol-3-phosphate 3-phosphatidyltransferase [Microbacteriaceae bacterium MWH-Ta3]
MSRRVLRSGEGPVSPWNVANQVTVARILLAPLFVWLLFADAHGPLRWVAFALFVVGTASDGVDGWLARSRNLRSSLGVILDPIADKVLIGAALVALSVLNELPWWITLVILVREIGITVFRMAILHREVHGASWAGKLKTVTQSIAVSLALAPFADLLGTWMYAVNTVVMAAAVVLTVWSGAEYLWKAWRAR